MMGAITIREARSADLPMILSLHRDLDSGPGLDLNAAEIIFERMKSYPSYFIFVAEVEDEIIGTFALLIMDNLVHRGAPSGIVEDVVVQQDWRGRGVGKEMMRYAMEKCKRARCYKLVLSSNENRKTAHRFYESLGFQRHGYSFLVPLCDEPDTYSSNLWDP